MIRSALEATIRDIEERLEEEDPAAFEDAVKLTAEYPQEPKVWNTLAYANEVNDDYVAASAAMTRAMELRPGLPASHFTRGGYFLMAGDYESAIADFTEGLARGNHLEQEPHREVLYFLRAEAFYQLGRKGDARADLEHVADDCTFWTIQVRSKAELVALCAE
jgi:tetratricopeptide (TPR) repeat protein